MRDGLKDGMQTAEAGGLRRWGKWP